MLRDAWRSLPAKLKSAWAARERHLAHLLVLAVLIATVPLALELYPDADISRSGDENFIDSVFSDPLVLTAAAVAVVYVAGFIVVSVLARVWNRQWLRRAGPFEISDEVKELRNSVERWQQRADRAETRIRELKDELADSNNLVSELHNALKKAGQQPKTPQSRGGSRRGRTARK